VDPSLVSRVQHFSGTPQFMAPEQWQQSHIDRRTDVYALGCTAHMMIDGSPPFTAENAIELGQAHTEPPSSVPEPRAPDEAYLFAAIERMLRKEPGRRYASADDVGDVLERIAAPEPTIEHGTDWALIGDVMVTLQPGDIADVEADVIVNAANWRLKMEVGVAGALKAAGGSSIEIEAMKEAPQPMGAVVWTHAGELKARWVAHCVAALDGAICLQRCVLRTLIEAESRQADTVAIPALGTGV